MNVNKVLKTGVHQYGGYKRICPKFSIKNTCKTKMNCSAKNLLTYFIIAGVLLCFNFAFHSFCIGTTIFVFIKS